MSARTTVQSPIARDISVLFKLAEFVRLEKLCEEINGLLGNVIDWKQGGE
jgi:hypothetical protein